MIDDLNPYAAPKAPVLIRDQHLDSSTDAWRDGNLLVVRKGAELTDRCLKCAAPTKAHRDRFSRLLSWHRPIWTLTFLISPLVYALVYFAVRKQGRVTVCLCSLHSRKQQRAKALGLLVALAGLGSIFAMGIVSDAFQPVALSMGMILLVVGLIGAALGSQVLVPRRIDRHFIWLGKVAPAILAELPDWNAPGGDQQ